MFKMIISKELILFTITLLLIGGCAKEEVQEEIIRPVRYQEVFFAGGVSSRTFTGTAKVGIESHLSFKVPGTIKNIRIKVGDVVSKGQLLIQLDDTDYNLQVLEAQAALKEAESQALNAKNNYDRIKLLYENNSTSKSELDGARTASESASAAVERLKNSLQLANLQLSYTRIRAPLNGTIASCISEINENVQAGQTVAVLNVGEDMEVDLGLPENVINRVQNGMGVIITFAALKNESFDGVVSEVSPSIDASSATYNVSVKILNPTKDVKSGMAANVTFSFGSTSTKEILVVPVAAVGEDNDGRFVYLVEVDSGDIGIVKKQHISIGELTPDGFEVVSGLSVNQKVATAGLQSLLDGQKVHLQ